MFFPIPESTGLAAANSFSGPPTMKVSVAALAPITPLEEKWEIVVKKWENTRDLVPFSCLCLISYFTSWNWSVKEDGPLGFSQSCNLFGGAWVNGATIHAQRTRLYCPGTGKLLLLIRPNWQNENMVIQLNEKIFLLEDSIFSSIDLHHMLAIG